MKLRIIGKPFIKHETRGTLPGAPPFFNLIVELNGSKTKC